MRCRVVRKLPGLRLPLTFAVLALVAFVAACTSPAPEPDSTATSVPPLPTSTPRPEPTEPTQMPTPKPTATPAPAPLPLPTATPEPVAPAATATAAPPAPTATAPPAATAAPAAIQPISLRIENADRLMTLHVEVIYDPEVLTPTDVKLGPGLDQALLDFEVEEPGRLVIGFIDAEGFTGDGPLLEIDFLVLDQDGTSGLELHELEAFGGEFFIDLLTSPRDGLYNGPGNAITPPLIRFGS